METKLTDFTSNELNWLYLVLDDKRKDWQWKVDDIETWPPSETKHDLYTHFNSQLDICTQWMTKVDEASKVVRTREILLTEN